MLLVFSEPIRIALPPGILASDGSELTIAVFDFMHSRGVAGEDAGEWLARFTGNQQAMFLTRTFGDAVRIDGFEPGYDKNRREYMAHSPGALRRIGE